MRKPKRTRSARMGLILAIVSTAATQAFAGGTDEAQYIRTPDSYTFTVGEMQITALSDGTVPQDLHKLMPEDDRQRVDVLLAASFQSNPVEASINAYLVRSGDRLMLVDTGAGQLFGPGLGGLLMDSLDSIGVSPEEITDVLLTHIHTDHSGGLIDDGEIAFPNATIHVGQAELDFFLNPSNAETSGYDQKYFDEAEETVGVYEDAGRVDGFSQRERILPHVVAMVHPGHTPGSAFYQMTSDGESIIFVGDIVHVEAVQLPEPEITIAYDVDPQKAVDVRERAFSTFAQERQLIAAPHLPFPGVGHLKPTGEDTYTWKPIPYRNRAGD